MVMWGVLGYGRPFGLPAFGLPTHPSPFVKLNKPYGGCNITMISYHRKYNQRRELALPKHGMQIDLTDSHTLLYTY